MRGFYAEWILANGAAEAAGLGTTFVLGSALAPLLMRASATTEILAGAVIAVVLGAMLEGVVIGAAQGAVLARHSDVRVRDWIVASAIGAGLAWVLGMTPSTVIALMTSGAVPTDAPPMQEPGALVTLALAIGLGALTGPILGAAQWRVLKRAMPGAGRWLWANAAAWAAGMPVIFAGMDVVPWAGPAPLRIATIYLVCAAAGVIVGAIHGRMLLRLLWEGSVAPQS